MLRTTVSAIALTTVLLCTLMFVFDVKLLRASETIFIKPDGSIEGTEKIQCNGDVYTFIDNIYDPIIVERDDIVVDGAVYTLQGTGGGKGIDLTSRSNVTVASATIKNFECGIWLEGSNYNSIIDNNITANNYCGIALYDSSNNNIISGNNITDNRYGITLSWSSSNNIIGNEFIKGGLDVWYSYQNSVENNTVNGKPIVYLESVSNYRVNNAGQAVLVKCDNIRVEGLDLSKTGIGVQLWETHNSIVENNTIGNNEHGIWLQYSSNNSIVGNNLVENSELGIWLQHSSDNSIVGNNITNNGSDGIWLDYSSNNTVGINVFTSNEYGIWLYFSSDNSIVGNNIVENNEGGLWIHFSPNNKIYHNSLINNVNLVHTAPEHTNTWDNGYPSGGNYWSDHNPPDEDLDKIGDVFYVIDENNGDRYPLVYPYGFVPKSDIDDDGLVNILDIATVASAYGSKPGDSNWNPMTDMDTNETINILDISTIAIDFGKTV